MTNAQITSFCSDLTATDATVGIQRTRDGGARIDMRSVPCGPAHAKLIDMLRAADADPGVSIQDRRGRFAWWDLCCE